MLQQFLNHRYTIVRVIGEGGFGKTFLTEDSGLPSRPRRVVKQLKPVTNNPQVYQMVKDRFHREAVILEDLGNRHDQIPKLYEYFSENGEFYLVQEYIEGKTLTEKVEKEGAFSESAVKEILKSLLSVLECVHSIQIIHRDIKPDNIIFRETDGKPVLIDFGAVRESMGTIVNSQGNSTSSVVIGTPGFMASEQAAGRPVYSSDLYSLALTMIYLLTGKTPLDLPTDPRTGNILWHEYAMHVSPSLRIVLDKATAYAPSDRYFSAREMLNALQTNSGGYVPATTPNLPPTSISSGGNPPQYISPISNSTPPYSPINYDSGYGTFDTSKPVPPEIQGWNWGAFLLSPIWSITNQVWVGLIAWIPYMGLPMPFILGIQGNVWAWRSRKWESVAQFKAHQRSWAKAGVIVYSSLFGLFFLLALIGVMAGDKSKSQSKLTQTPTPSISAAPRSEPTPINTPTTESSTRKFAPVEIANLETYTYNTGLFSINVPEGWTLKDKTDSGEAIIQWQDSTRNAFIQVNVFGVEGERSQQQLSLALRKTIKLWVGSQPGFTMSKPALLNGGVVRISWSHTVTIDGLTGKLVGNSFIKQHGNKVSIITDLVPEEQFDRLKPELEKILGSYKIDSAASLPQ
ncbi:MAG: serine/threonine-protein kinase [Nostocaceae cyanobacterium]|nr:serine/threonine-protein kinase [Nostocaceae cyanobacterium]